jgi:hypothetical protein
MLLEILVGSAVASLLTTVGAATITARAGRAKDLASLLLVAIGGGVAALLVNDPGGWPWSLAVTALLPSGLLLLGRRSAWTGWARITAVTLTQTALVYLVYAALVTALTAQGLAGVLLGSLLWLIQLASLILMLSFAFEILDVLGRRRFPARDAVLATPEPEVWPAICIQIPAYNEPPDLLAETIKQVMHQQYPGRWMVQVVDNNTPDEEIWRPIEELCRSLGDRVTFMHLADWPGFKAGALNEATRRLPDWVEVLAVVDADYLVSPDFLRATAVTSPIPPSPSCRRPRTTTSGRTTGIWPDSSSPTSTSSTSPWRAGTSTTRSSSAAPWD